MVEFNRAIVMSWVYCFWAEDVSQWVIDIRLNSVVLRRYLRSKYGRRRTSPGSLESVVMAVHTDISRILWANASVKSKLPWQVDSVHYRKETTYIYKYCICERTKKLNYCFEYFYSIFAFTIKYLINRYHPLIICPLHYREKMTTSRGLRDQFLRSNCGRAYS